MEFILCDYFTYDLRGQQGRFLIPAPISHTVGYVGPVNWSCERHSYLRLPMMDALF